MMKIRLGIPKHHKTWSGLAALAFAVPSLSGRLGGLASQWMILIAGVTFAAALSVMVAGMIAERKELQQEQQRRNGAEHDAA